MNYYLVKETERGDCCCCCTNYEDVYLLETPKEYKDIIETGDGFNDFCFHMKKITKEEYKVMGFHFKMKTESGFLKTYKKYVDNKDRYYEERDRER
jgi:hypothetical protein